VTYLIRPEVIAQYHQESVSAWNDRNKMIAERDDEYRELNREFDVRSENGTFTSSYMGQAGAQYHARYREISDRFQPRYDAISSREQEWRQSLALTISEFLFLDNFFSPLLEKLCSDKRFAGSYRSDLLRMKAVIHIEDWKAKENVGGILGRIASEKSLFPYAAKRCRTFFQIGMLDVKSRLAIRQFGNDWQTALNEAIGRVRLP
jgi:hypothetical protein